MAAYLMTHSLLSSWLYAIKDNPYEDATTERDPMAEFMQVLRREPTETTEAMRNGIDFEDLVTEIVNGHGDTENKWFDAAQKVASIVRGGQLQYKARKTIIPVARARSACVQRFSPKRVDSKILIISHAPLR